MDLKRHRLGVAVATEQQRFERLHDQSRINLGWILGDPEHPAVRQPNRLFDLDVANCLFVIGATDLGATVFRHAERRLVGGDRSRFRETLRGNRRIGQLELVLEIIADAIGARLAQAHVVAKLADSLGLADALTIGVASDIELDVFLVAQLLDCRVEYAHGPRGQIILAGIEIHVWHTDQRYALALDHLLRFLDDLLRHALLRQLDAEIESGHQRLAEPQYARVLGRELGASGQGRGIDLDDIVGAALDPPSIDPGDVKATVKISFDEHAVDSRDANTRDAFLGDTVVGHGKIGLTALLDVFETNILPGHPARHVAHVLRGDTSAGIDLEQTALGGRHAVGATREWHPQLTRLDWVGFMRAPGDVAQHLARTAELAARECDTGRVGRILKTVTIAVVEDLADDRRLFEQRVLGQAHRRARLVGNSRIAEILYDRGVEVVAGIDAGADPKQIT